MKIGKLLWKQSKNEQKKQLVEDEDDRQIDMYRKKIRN